jgi:hypothetical protein
MVTNIHKPRGERRPAIIIIIFVCVFPGRANIKHTQSTTTSTTMKKKKIHAFEYHFFVSAAWSNIKINDF